MSTVKKPAIGEKKAFKLDIFSILSRLNKSELDLWNTLSEEEQKGFSAYVITRWMSGTKDAYQLTIIDEFVNNHLFNLGTKDGFKIDHTELFCKLLACCGLNDSRRFVWKPESKKSGKMSSMALDIVKEYYDFSEREAKQSLPLLSSEDVIQLAEELGYQVDEIKKLKKELG
jgi:hypothetical protein